MSKKIQVLQQAYMNDLVDSQDYSEKYLDSLVLEGLLENKHRHHRTKRYVYWISQKGLDYLNYYKSESRRGI